MSGTSLGRSGEWPGCSAKRDGELLQQVQLLLHADLHAGVEDRVAFLLAGGLDQ
jgi:hypothetical protein